MIGFEEHDWDTVESTVRFAGQMRLKSEQLLILTPLPGSELVGRPRAKGRITSSDWELHDMIRIRWSTGRRVSRRSNSSAPK